ncbi:MAG: ABC transporter substrate-binding protein [Rhodospirillales bacterium]|nr:ABC transporter substrate-binding protein [Rhodospirillales bacterium]
MTHLLAGAAFAVLGVCSSAYAQGCAPQVPAADLIKPGHLVMSTNPTLPPLQYVDSHGKLRGMRIELGTDIAKRLCLKQDYIQIDFDAMIPGLAGGRWDMINTGIFYTPARAKLMYMILYENQAISISVRNADKGKITKPSDLAGKTVGVEIGGFEEAKTRELSKELQAKGLKGLNIRTFNTFATAYQALRAGQVDAVTSIDGVAEQYQKRGDFTRSISGLFPTPVALAFKNKDLAEHVLKVLDQMRKDGTYGKLFAAYGTPPYPGPFVLKGPGL